MANKEEGIPDFLEDIYSKPYHPHLILTFILVLLLSLTFFGVDSLLSVLLLIISVVEVSLFLIFSYEGSKHSLLAVVFLVGLISWLVFSTPSFFVFILAISLGIIDVIIFMDLKSISIEDPFNFASSIFLLAVGLILWPFISIVELLILLPLIYTLIFSFFSLTTQRWGPKDNWNAVSFIIGIGILAILVQTAIPLLIILFSFYMVLSLLMIGKNIKIQTAIIVGLAITAIIFRVYPAMDTPGNPMAGHLVSMDDPYYHYKLTDDLFVNGDLTDVDPRTYPPEGANIPHIFPYYYNTYATHLTGNSSIHHIILLYPVLLSAFGAIMMYFLLKELMKDWKSGLLGGFFFATMPMIITKSTAAATEEDLMGLVLGVFAIYLLVKAIRSDRRASIKFAVFSGIAFMTLLMTWSGFLYLYAVPFTAIALYAGVALLLRHNIWDTTRVALIAGAIPLIGGVLIGGVTKIGLAQIGPFGLMLFLGILAEFLRTWLWKQEDTKLDFEKKLFVPVAVIVIIGALIFLALNAGDIVEFPQKLQDSFSGKSASSFMVEKTISEQSALATGDLAKKLGEGFKRYGIAEVFTLIMAAIIPLILIYYFLSKNKDKFFDLLLPYLIGVLFFAVAMIFVWGQARLGFSQSLGFLMLGAMVGILLPKSFKELSTPESSASAMGGVVKMLFLFAIIIAIPLTTFYPNIAGAAAWQHTYRPASIDDSWFNGIKWLENNIETGRFDGGNYINGDFVLTWWDYGHIITALSPTTVITDPLQRKEEYIMRTARFFYNMTGEEEGMAWLMTQPWNLKEDGEYKTKYIILDFSLVGKAGALAFLGTNEYEYPNGMTAANGECSQGVVCQNIQNGEVAQKVDGKLTCSQGEVCQRDLLTKITPKMCCEKAPTQCCETSLSNRVIPQEGGTGRIYRSPQTPVYGQYQLDTKNAACRPEYATSTEPIFVIEDGERKTVNYRLLYTGYAGLPFGDGGNYPAFVIFSYSDGTQSIKMVSANCQTKEYDEVMGLGKDFLVDMKYRVRINEDMAVPQVFVHVPEKWMNNMFTQLFMFDAENLKNFELILDEDMQKNRIYPGVKIYKITYPDGIPDAPELPESGAQNGDLAAVQYTGKFTNGTIFDSSVGGDPLEFRLGVGQLIPGFENAVLGMELGDSKEVTVPPEDAYGVNGTHRLAGETLVFEITLVSLNGETVEEPAPEVPTPQSNMTFDYYDPAIVESYSIAAMPSLVWNCYYKRFGMSSSALEADMLTAITCVVNKGKPTSICAPVGVVYNETSGSLLASGDVMEYLNAVSKIEGSEQCPPGNDTVLIQAFHSQDCNNCPAQKAVLDSLEAQFGDSLGVDYYCVGDETACLEGIE